jgi:hypothetical protein
MIHACSSGSRRRTRKSIDHRVQFYESDDHLVESICEYLSRALDSGDVAMLIAETVRRAAIENWLSEQGYDLESLSAAGLFFSFDALETLTVLMKDGLLDRELFYANLGPRLDEIFASGRKVSAFGEMVAILLKAGQAQAAIDLEELWNEVARSRELSILCAYPVGAFVGEKADEIFSGICKTHTHIVPAESFSALESERERMEAVGILQQKARALDYEIARRRAAEHALDAHLHDVTVLKEINERLSKFEELHDSFNVVVEPFFHDLRRRTRNKFKM